MIIKNEKGIAIPLVLMIVVVVSFLGAAIMQSFTADTMQVKRDKERVQAYYLARSGADATAAAIIQDQNNVENINIGGSSPIATVNLGSGNFTVDIDKFDDRLELKSTGKVNNVSQTVTLTMPKANVSDIFDNVIYSYNNLYLNSVTILSGNLATEEDTIQTNSTFHGSAQTNCQRDYPSPTFPSLALQGSCDVGNGSATISQDGEYSSISTGPNGSITFDTSTAPNNVLNIVADSLYIKGDLTATGPGTVFLFIKKPASASDPDPELQTPHSTTANIFILLEDGVNLNFQAASVDFNGYIYGPNATISMNSNHANITGAIIINDISWTHSGTLAYQQPSSSINLGSAVIIYKRGSWSH